MGCQQLFRQTFTQNFALTIDKRFNPVAKLEAMELCLIHCQIGFAKGTAQR
jgi:hypothetical protein